MDKILNKKILTVILLVAGVIIVAISFFLTKDDPASPPEQKPDTEIPIEPDDDDIIIPEPEPTDPIDPIEPDDPIDPIKPDDDITPPDDDDIPKPGDNIPKPGDCDDPDETTSSDWQIFSNEVDKFEISYPDTHIVHRDSPGTKVFSINVKDDPEYIEGIFIKLGDDAGTADDVIERVEEDNENDVLSKILEDRTVYLFNIKTRKITATSPRGFHSSHYFFSRSGVNYEIMVNDEDDLCEEIISSFKLIN